MSDTPAKTSQVEVVVGTEADAVGRAVRELLDRGEATGAFVGDPDADAEALEEFRHDVIRDELMTFDVIQVSDLHITDGGELHGQDPRLAVDLVFDDIAARALRPDVIVATGDLANAGEPAA